MIRGWKWRDRLGEFRNIVKTIVPDQAIPDLVAHPGRCRTIRRIAEHRAGRAPAMMATGSHDRLAVRICQYHGQQVLCPRLDANACGSTSSTPGSSPCITSSARSNDHRPWPRVTTPSEATGRVLDLALTEEPSVTRSVMTSDRHYRALPTRGIGVPGTRDRTDTARQTGPGRATGSGAWLGL